jgi:hypothetical protein
MLPAFMAGPFMSAARAMPPIAITRRVPSCANSKSCGSIPTGKLALGVPLILAIVAGISLASGAPYTYHADFFNAWNPASLAGFIDSCLHANKVCGTVT